MDAKAEDILAKGGRLHLKILLPRLTALSNWSGGEAEAVVRAYGEEIGAKLGTVAQPLRAALTGRSTSPGIFDVLERARPRGKPRPDRRSGRGRELNGSPRPLRSGAAGDASRRTFHCARTVTFAPAITTASAASAAIAARGR